VHFKKGESKEAEARPLIDAAAAEGGDGKVVLIGIAREKPSVWRSWPSKGQEKAAHPRRPSSWIARTVAERDVIVEFVFDRAGPQAVAPASATVASITDGRSAEALLPHLDADQGPQAVLLPLPGIRRLPIRARGSVEPAGPRRLPRPPRLEPGHRVVGRPQRRPNSTGA